MERQSQRQPSRDYRVRVLHGYGAPHTSSVIANEQRVRAWLNRKAYRAAMPAIQFEIPIYKPE